MKNKKQNYRETLIDFCEEIISRAEKSWKPLQVFRSDMQVEIDEAIHSEYEDLADKARNILKDIGEEA